MIKIRAGLRREQKDGGAKKHGVIQKGDQRSPLHQVFINKRWDQVTANCEL